MSRRRLPQVQPSPVLTCNRCGECCRRGGACTLRNVSWSLQDLPYSFEGSCELLDGNECTVLRELVRTGQADFLKLFKVVGECDFPDWRKELSDPIFRQTGETS